MMASSDSETEEKNQAEELRNLLPQKYDFDRENEKVSCPWFQARYALSFWAFLGFFNIYCLRINLSVALVSMVNSTSSTDNTSVEACPDPNGYNSSTSSAKFGEFNWDQNTQGIILGSFFYGYILTQLPGGWLAERYGGKKLFGFGVLCTSVLTLLTPVAARWSLPAFIAVRVLEGIGEGVTFPSMHALWGNWAPVWERSKLAGFAAAGAQLGTVFSMPISGFLCDSDFLGGWPSVFYVFGTLGCLFCLMWLIFVFDSPAEHPRITQKEREYIENSIGKREKLSTPWKKILTSSALWGIAAGHFANNWGGYTMLTCLPMFMKKILMFDIKQDGLLSALPYLMLWTVQVISGFLADYLRTHNYLTTSGTRKVFNSVGLLLPAAFLIGVSYVGCSQVWAVTLLTLGLGGNGFAVAGYNVNHLDIAPKFAGTLLGITNALATIPGFIGPQVVGILTNHDETRGQWRIVFFLTSGIYVLGALLFAVFARGEEVPWAREKPKISETIIPPPNDPSLKKMIQEPGEPTSIN